MNSIPLLISLFTQNTFAATPFANTIEAGYLAAQFDAHQYVSSSLELEQRLSTETSGIDSEGTDSESSENDDSMLTEPGDALAARRKKGEEAG